MIILRYFIQRIALLDNLSLIYQLFMKYMMFELFIYEDVLSIIVEYISTVSTTTSYDYSKLF